MWTLNIYSHVVIINSDEYFLSLFSFRVVLRLKYLFLHTTYLKFSSFGPPLSVLVFGGCSSFFGPAPPPRHARPAARARRHHISHFSFSAGLPSASRPLLFRISAPPGPGYLEHRRSWPHTGVRCLRAQLWGGELLSAITVGLCCSLRGPIFSQLKLLHRRMKREGTGR